VIDCDRRTALSRRPSVAVISSLAEKLKSNIVAIKQ